PSSAASAVLIATATCAGPVPADEHFSPSPANLAQNLRKPFSVSPPNGTNGCLASIIACTTPVSPPCAVMPSNFLWTAMAWAGPFCAVGSSPLPMTSTTSHFLPDPLNTSWMPSWRSRSTDVPDTPRTSSTLPPFGTFFTSHSAQYFPRPFWSTLTLMASSVSRMLSNATSTTPASLARLITGLNAAGFCAFTTIASQPKSMKLLTAAICAATSSPVETTLNSFSLAATSGCAAYALAVLIIWIRHVLAMYPLASAIRYGPFFAGY